MSDRSATYRRLVATLFLVALFAALPTCVLSGLEGWISIDCVRTTGSTALDCTVHERFVFSSRATKYSVMGARGTRREQHDRRGRMTSYQLALMTPAGALDVLNAYTGNADLARVAAELDAAIRSGAPEFHGTVSPDLGFWFVGVLVVVFAASGLLIAVMTHRSRRNREKRP